MIKTMKKLLTIGTVLTAMLVSTVSVNGAVSLEDKVGDQGEYTIAVHNGATTGVDITDDWFHAYQIFTANDITSYAVAEDFQGFFSGDDMVAGDGSGVVYNFQAQLDVMYSESVSDSEKELATAEYNQLAGQYMSTYAKNLYTLAAQVRTYLDENGYYNIGGDGITCMAHSQAQDNGDSTQTAYLEGLSAGYYFVMDQESTVAGLGIAASGAFVPIVNNQEETTIIIEVKDSVPTVVKEIFHDDENAWDVVGDHAIGDTAEFLITSTVPSNIEDYDTYTYVLSDVMSNGITYNGDVKVYADFARTILVDSTYLTIDNDPAGGETFTITVDMKGLLEANNSMGTLYTYYTGVVNTNAVVATGHDTNTVTLEYSNNPSNSNQTGTSSATVFHYTFALNVIKVDESLAGLAGARFGIFLDDGTAVPLSIMKVDTTTGVVYYCYDAAATPVEDGGYIVTQDVTLDDGSVVTGKFQIYGLNDAKTYILKEVEAPADYNAVDDTSFLFTPAYTGTGTGLTSLTDGSTNISTVDFESTITIMNRLIVFLPSTGGVGTVVFQVGGGALMLAAVVLLAKSRKKEEK